MKKIFLLFILQLSITGSFSTAKGYIITPTEANESKIGNGGELKGTPETTGKFLFPVVEKLQNFKNPVVSIAHVYSNDESISEIKSDSTKNASSIKVTLLGTGTPLPDIDRMGSATLIEAGQEKLLVDVGRGTTIRLKQAGIHPSILTAVFITHFHSDHVVGLPDLWLLGHIPSFYRDRPLDVYGPSGIQSLVYGITEAFAKDVQLRANPARPGPELKAIKFEEPGVVFDRGGVKVTAIPVDHVQDSYAYRIDYAGRSVVISGDASPSDSLIAAATEVDLLVNEIMDIQENFLESRPPEIQLIMHKVLSTHTTPLQAANMLPQVKPRLVVFNHVSLIEISEDQVLKKIRSSYEGRVEIGKDLMTITVGEEVIIGDR